MKTHYIIFTTLIMLAAVAAQANPLEFTISPGGDNLIQFVSKAPLEKITGTTSQVSGVIALDPADLKALPPSTPFSQPFGA